MAIKSNTSTDRVSFDMNHRFSKSKDIEIVYDKIINNTNNDGILSFNRSSFINKEEEKLVELQEQQSPRMRTSIDYKILSSYDFLTENNSSGSAQFTGPELRFLLKEIKTISLLNQKEITDLYIIDLRKEDHGFINEFPVMIRAKENNVNGNIDEKLILEKEQNFFNELKENFLQDSIIEVASVTKKINGSVQNADLVLIKDANIETEKELVTRIANELDLNGIRVHYQRFLIQDHNKPSDDQVNNFIEFFRNNSSPTIWKHFHCSAGHGRTTTFEVMNHLLMNAHLYANHDSGFSENPLTCSTELDSILQYHHEVGGSLLNPNNKNVKNYKISAAQERYEFLQKFYEYAISDHGFLCQDHEVSWYEWIS